MSELIKLISISYRTQTFSSISRDIALRHESRDVVFRFRFSVSRSCEACRESCRRRLARLDPAWQWGHRRRARRRRRRRVPAGRMSSLAGVDGGRQMTTAVETGRGLRRDSARWTGSRTVLVGSRPASQRSTRSAAAAIPVVPWSSRRESGRTGAEAGTGLWRRRRRAAPAASETFPAARPTPTNSPSNRPPQTVSAARSLSAPKTEIVQRRNVDYDPLQVTRLRGSICEQRWLWTCLF